MVEFTKRQMERSKTLGERLRKVREEAGVSLDEAASATQIQRTYLTALEEGNYSILPGPVYVESFLKKYAEYLKVSSSFVLNLYRQQDKKIVQRGYTLNSFLPERQSQRDIITPKLIRNASIVLVVASLLAYIILEVANVFSPPSLTIDSPQDFTSVTEGTITVMGTTEPESELTINGRQVYLDPSGRFSVAVNLTEGVNEIIVTATKKRSKPTTVQRSVILE
ncbi:MAG: helix-turn-helix domain-containing protein [Patescibacteria group bacterium]